MTVRRLSIWEHARLRGYSRRDFIRFCGWMAAAAGIHSSGLPRVVRALESKPRLPVVWFHFQECTCCSESFLRSPQPIVSDIILDMISLDYSEMLQAAAGRQAEEALQRTLEENRGEYLMMVEGAVPTGEGGIYCCIGGRTALDILTGAAADARAIIAWGSCASNGCVQAAAPNPTGATPV
ncbi:MAG: hydrogenase small subunit, partial [Acidobacteria bacterium]|nr:hydrogenase small subunit [Acidobacteriota bacterium]